MTHLSIFLMFLTTLNSSGAIDSWICSSVFQWARFFPFPRGNILSILVLSTNSLPHSRYGHKISFILLTFPKKGVLEGALVKAIDERRRCCKLAHLSKRASGTQEKKPFSSTLSHDVFHHVASGSTKNHWIEASDWLSKNLNQSEGGFLSYRRNKTDRTMWKGIINCARIWCLFLCTILFEDTYVFRNMWWEMLPWRQNIILDWGVTKPSIQALIIA